METKSGQLLRIVRFGSGRRIDGAALVFFPSSLGIHRKRSLPSLLGKSEPAVLVLPDQNINRKADTGMYLPFGLVAGGGLEPPTSGL